MHLSSANIALSAFLSFICKYFGFSESDSLTMVQITFISSKILDIYLNGGPEMFLSKVFIRSQYPSPIPPVPDSMWTYAPVSGGIAFYSLSGVC